MKGEGVMRKSIVTGAAAAIALAVLMGAATVSAYAVTARPQRGAAQRRGVGLRWEYAIISRVTESGVGAPPDVRYRGVATLCYVRVGGCQELRIEGSGRVEALARAIARLGSEGWEMVGESPFPLERGMSEGALFFKRRSR